MTLTFRIHLESLKEHQRATYLGQKTISSNVIWLDTQTDTHTLDQLPYLDH